MLSVYFCATHMIPFRKITLSILFNINEKKYVEDFVFFVSIFAFDYLQLILVTISRNICDILEKMQS